MEFGGFITSMESTQGVLIQGIALDTKNFGEFKGRKSVDFWILVTINVL